MSGVMLGAIIPGVASAQTGLAQVESLLAQIKALQAQIASLTQQKQQLQATTTQTVLEILQGMQPGTEGEQVKLLQTLLSTDPSLYPEGKITGYYGPATRRAIERFQRREGLESVGSVGPRTRAALNKWIKEQFKQVEDLEDELEDDALEELEDIFGSIAPTSSSNPCVIPTMPTGTPGIIKDGKVKIIQTGNVYIYKDGKHQIIITPNSYIEKDGKKKLVITPGMRMEKDGKWSSVTPCNGGTGTTTPPATGSDTTAPTISSIVASPAQTSVGITWSTNEPASGKVYYGTTSPLNLASAASVNESSWWSQWHTNHSVNIAGLAASTTYYFIVESKDKKGNTATSTQQSFKTAATPDTTAPSISAVSVTQVGTSTARISWTTNEASNSVAYFGTTTPLNTGSAQMKSDASMVTSHVLELSGLMPGTTYYFKVESKDAANNGNMSTESSFTTSVLPDTSAPTISSIVVTPSTTTAQVTWNTNEAATSKAYYGTSTPLSLGSAANVSQSAFVTNHSLSLTGLTASTTYYIIVESKDAATNGSVSTAVSFQTL